MTQTDSLLEWIASPYTSPPPRGYQDAYLSLLKHQLASDCARIAAMGITPPWKLEPDDLQQDEARLLAYCADNCGIKWADNSTDTCLTTTKNIGLTAIGNAKAVIARCFDLGYITVMFAGDGVATINATLKGMDALEDYEDQKEAGIL
jgi:hypothetical protein